MTATLAAMPKKRTDPVPADTGARKTTSVRIDDDLVTKLNHIATHRGVSVSEIISPHLRPFVERLYADTVREMADKLED